MRTALRTLIYDKTLKLSSTAKAKMNTGDIINLMNIDTMKICEVISWAHYVWGAPMIVIVCLIFLFYMLKYATFFGLAVMLCM